MYTYQEQLSEGGLFVTIPPQVLRSACSEQLVQYILLVYYLIMQHLVCHEPLDILDTGFHVISGQILTNLGNGNFSYFICIVQFKQEKVVSFLWNHVSMICLVLDGIHKQLIFYRSASPTRTPAGCARSPRSPRTVTGGSLVNHSSREPSAHCHADLFQGECEAGGQGGGHAQNRV
jgi:hypothetical protein